MKVIATQTTICVNLWRKPSSNYLTGQIQGKQRILEVFKCEESVQNFIGSGKHSAGDDRERLVVWWRAKKAINGGSNGLAVFLPC